MNYNYIWFHLQKLQLGPIDVAFQDLQYALKNSSRDIFVPFFPSFYHVFFIVFIVDPTDKFLNCMHK